jgi:hypothetical protein
VHLGGGEDGSVFLYISPTFGTKSGSYDMKLKADSGKASDEIELTVEVPEISMEPPETGEPSEPSGNVSINVTHPSVGDNETAPPITGGAVEERPFWKTAAVAVIALIIIAILVLRFVLLLKK